MRTKWLVFLLFALTAIWTQVVHGRAQAANGFTHGVVSSSDRATVGFKPDAGIDWVDVHYVLAGQGQQNFRMAWNAASGRYETVVQPAATGQSLQYQFTYNVPPAYDSAWFSVVLGAPPVGTPTFSPGGGNYAGAQSVTIATSTSGADIRYTTDGSTPTAQSAAYPGALTLPVPTTLQALTFVDGKPLADQPSRWNLDAASLLERDDKTLAQCPQSGRLLLRLEDDNPLDGPRESFDVTIFNPCWLWEDAQLQGITSVTVRAGRIPYNFGLLREEEAKRGFRTPVAPHGEFEVRAGCEGPVLASAPLPAQPGKDGFIELQAPLRNATAITTDLCMTFSGDTRPQMWVLDRVSLHVQP